MRRRSDDGIIVGVGIHLSKATIMSEVTRILSAIEQGDQKASEQLLPLVYRVAKAGCPEDGTGESRPNAAGHCAGA